MKEVIVISVVSLVACCSLLMSYEHFKDEQHNYVSSSECVSKLVSQGVERSQISTMKDTCFIN